MRRLTRRKIVRVGIVIVSFFIVFIITYVMNDRYIKEHTDLIQVAVAARKIPAYSAIKPEDVIISLRPRSVVACDAIFTNSFLSNSTAFTGDVGFAEGDIITGSRLADQGSVPVIGMLSLLQEQKMLVSVNTNLIRSCANLVVPGTLVNAVVFMKGDVLGHPDKVIGPQEDPRLAQLLVVDKKNGASAVPADEGRDALPEVITLLLERDNLDTAKALVEYNEKGCIYLLPIGFKGDIYSLGQSNGY